MLTFIFFLVVVTCLATFCLLLANKWGLVEWVQIHGNEFFSKMFNCWFCLSFWTSVILSILFIIFTGEWMLLAIPLCSTPLVRKLL